jgi:hypothetical protein
MKVYMKLVMIMDFTVKSVMFPHHNIHKYSWMSTDRTAQPDWPYSDTQAKAFQVYSMMDHSGQQIVILATIWLWQKLGRD